jgi:5-formyltetrahydrofolate cyclo-ligase
LGPEVRAALAARLAADGLAVARNRRATIVSVFLPIRDEPDTGPLLEALSAAGFATALPATPPRGQPLRFRAWRPGDALAAGRFGTCEPAPDVPDLDPDLLFVPLAAFDARGGRLGYGAGYYDGALRRLRALKPILAVGVAFAAQEVAAVPAEPHDEPLDALLTERGLTIFGA